MWLFTQHGFISAVEWQKKDEHEGMIVLRAREQGDLDRVRKFMPEMTTPVVVTPSSDYRFRVWIEAEAFGRGLARLAEDIDYGNFKSRVADRLGHRRSNPLHDIWTIMGRLQKGGPYGMRNRSTKRWWRDTEADVAAQGNLWDGSHYELVPSGDGDGLEAIEVPDYPPADDYIGDRVREAFSDDETALRRIRPYLRGGREVRGYVQKRRRKRR